MKSLAWLPALLLLLAAVRPAPAQDEEAFRRLFAEGNRHYREGRPEAAAESYRKALARKDDPDVRFNLGNALYRAGDRAGAAEAYRAALALRKDFPEASLNLGMALFEADDCDGALRALASAPPSGRVWRVRAACFERLGDLEAEAFALRSASQLSPRDRPLRLSLGGVLYRLQRYDEAAEAFRYAVRLDPLPPDAYRLLAWTLLALERNLEALEALEMAHHLAPEKDEKVEDVLAGLYEAQGLPGEAAALRENAASPSPDAGTRLRLAGLYRRAGDPGNAERHLRALLEAEPDHAAARVRLGELLVERGAEAQAAPWFRGALAAGRPGIRARALHGLGRCLLASGDPDGARDSFGKAVEADPAHAPSLLGLGRLLFLEGKYRRAAERFRAALSARPQDPAAGRLLDLALSEAARGS